MSMLEQFFSVKYAGRSDLFQGLSIWQEEKYRKLQGTYPVIHLSFADVREADFESAKEKICRILTLLYREHRYLLDNERLKDTARVYYQRVGENMDFINAATALSNLSYCLWRYYDREVIILLDEYDTPWQEAFVHGYEKEWVAFMRSLLLSTFKSTHSAYRGIITGLTQIAEEPISSELNMNILTVRDGRYANIFGFNEEDVLAALSEYGLVDQMQEVRRWYGGYVFGECRNIFHPSSVMRFLSERNIG